LVIRLQKNKDTSLTIGHILSNENARLLLSFQHLRGTVPWPKHFGSKETIVKLRDLLILAGSVAAATHASALSLGNTQGQVQLGSPIDLVFQVQPDPGQTADSSCIAADVWMGNAALAGSQVLVTPQAQSVRVQTTAAVYEPLITLKLRAGCNGAMSRTYTFFADPPKSLATSVEPIDLSKIQINRSAAATARTAAAPAATAAPVARAPRTAKKAVNPQAALETPSKPTPAPSVETTPAKEIVQTPTIEAGNAATDKPRLRVEPLEGMGTGAESAPANSDQEQPPALEVIDAETQALLDANAARLETLEKQLLTLQSQLTKNRTETNSLQTQLVQAQNQGLPLWVHILMGLLALAIATIAWLLQRMKQERQLAQGSWANTVLAAEGTLHSATIDTHAQAPTPSAVVEPLTPAVPTTTSKADSAPPAPPELGRNTQLPTLSQEFQDTALYAEFESTPTPSPAEQPAPSIAEVLTAQALFDVQEQAEFYASIGENDQAIEILQAHIAEHVASAPLAYIELLQLLYRLSRTEAFEEVREKFQTYFNVQVPDFLGFARKGRDLSGYPEVLGQIEALWPTDDVQGLMRNLIVHRPAAESSIRFDLAAFDDLLMLYNVAQTTPASSRGQLPGRVRMTPHEVPLPEIVFPGDALPAATLPTTAAALAPPPLPLHEAQLDMLTASPVEAPLPSLNQPGDSPFQSPGHFTPDEVLIDDLSLNWDTPNVTGTEDPQKRAVDDPSMDDALNFFKMDERDLPPTPPEKKN